MKKIITLFFVALWADAGADCGYKIFSSNPTEKVDVCKKLVTNTSKNSFANDTAKLLTAHRTAMRSGDYKTALEVSKKIASLQKAAAKQESDLGHWGYVDYDYFLWVTAAPYLYLKDIGGYIKAEQLHRDYAGSPYWDSFFDSFVKGELDPDMAILNMNLKKEATCQSIVHGKKSQQDLLKSFWTSGDTREYFDLQRESYELSKSTKPSDKIPNIYSWYFCNASLFGGDTKNALKYCREYAEYTNYYDPHLYRNREYAVALFLAESHAEAKKQFELYKRASGEPRTLEETVASGCYPQQTKAHVSTDNAQCFLRSYSALHLANHPTQKVAELKIGGVAENKYKISVRFRDAAIWATDYATCTSSDTKQRVCKMACDGGTFILKEKNGRYMLENRGFKLGSCTPNPILVDPKQDQKDFMVAQVDPRLCL